MVAKYQKIDLAAFKKKLSAGEYANLTGARRAIGRMTTWSEAEKNKARAAAEKHFAEGAPASSPKKAAKKTPKKAAKKSKSAAPAAAKPPKAPAKKAVKKVRKPQAKAKGSAVRTGVPVKERIEEANRLIDGFGSALGRAEEAKNLGAPNEAVRAAAKEAMDGLTMTVNYLCQLTQVASADLSSTSGGNGAANAAWQKAVEATSVQQPIAAPQPTTPTSSGS